MTRSFRPPAPPNPNGSRTAARTSTAPTSTKPDRSLTALDRAISAYLWASGTIHRTAPRPVFQPDAMTLRVTRRRIVAHDQNVVELTLGSADGPPLPPWHPGAHLDLHLPSGRRRQYSLCGDPADRSAYRIAVRLIPDGDGGSREVHGTLHEGAPVTVSGPRNAFAFVPPGHGSPARRVRLIAGGIGITPILPMARMADALGVDWSMVHTGRSADSLPFAEEIAALGPRARVRTDDVHGLPTAAELLGPADAGGTAVYCCGPPPMVAGLLDAVRTRAVAEFHYERFSAPRVVDGRPFTVELARSGLSIEVPADRTALSAVLDVAPHTPYSCRQGYCRTCTVRVLSGDVDHRDSTLTDAERADGDMLICVSRAWGDRIRLDL